MKTKKCQNCKRRVRQQEWKTEEEKKTCFTCSQINQLCEAIEESVYYKYNQRINVSWAVEEKKL